MVTTMQLAEVFRDTMDWIKTDAELQKAAQHAKEQTVLYREEDPIPVPEASGTETGISVTQERSLEAALRLMDEFPQAKIAVLNFASATHPGGGVINGARAQEECICRCTTLYPALAQASLQNDYYAFHRARHNARYTDAVIYTPDVRIVKTDTEVPERLPEAQYRSADMITCAAPNLGAMPAGTVSEAELREILLRRVRRIYAAAAAHGAEVLVLGAFGCGAFRNPPALAAEAFQTALAEFQGRFRHICFAVWCPPGKPANYNAFAEEFKVSPTD